MSDASEVLQDTIAELETLNPYRYSILAQAVVYSYDVLLTLPIEIGEIWSFRLSFAKIVYLLHRYSSLLNIVFSGFFLGPFSTRLSLPLCSGINFTISGLGIIANITGETILILRTYALYQSKWIIVLLLPLSLSVVVMGSVTDFGGQSILSDLTGTCFYSNENIKAEFTTAFEFMNVVFNSLILLLTLLKTWGQYREMRRLKLGFKHSIVTCLLRDGIIYYCMDAFPRLLDAVITLPSITPRLSLTAFYALDSLPIISPIALNRLVLSLSRTGHRVGDDFSLHTSRFNYSAPFFAAGSVIDNLGEPVRVDGLDDEGGSSEDSEESYATPNRTAPSNTELSHVGKAV